MTEAEWLKCTDPQKMLEFLRVNSSDRKLRLFACACCRRTWHLLTDKRSHKAVEVLEQYVDGMADEEQLRSVAVGADAVADDAFAVEAHASEEAASAVACGAYCGDLAETASNAARAIACVAGSYGSTAWETAKEGEAVAQCHLLRDIFYNPFRPVLVDPAWLTPPVVRLACTVYDERTFDRMPDLADALEKADCGNADILAHCRQPGEHVRGCWVVDLLLGKR